MGAPEIIHHLRAIGVNLSLRGDKLIATPSDLVTPEILGLLRAHKPELLAALTKPQPPISNATEAEITRLVRLFSRSQRFTQEDTDEALQVALDHPENALVFYLGQVKQLGLQ